MQKAKCLDKGNTKRGYRWITVVLQRCSGQQILVSGWKKTFYHVRYRSQQMPHQHDCFLQLKWKLYCKNVRTKCRHCGRRVRNKKRAWFTKPVWLADNKGQAKENTRKKLHNTGPSKTWRGTKTGTQARNKRRLTNIRRKTGNMEVTPGCKQTNWQRVEENTGRMSREVTLRNRK